MRRLLADQQGVAALEFALLLPMLSALALATADLALLASRTQQVHALAQSAAAAIARLPEIPAAASSPYSSQATSLPGRPGSSQYPETLQAISTLSRAPGPASPTDRRQLLNPDSGSPAPASPEPGLAPGPAVGLPDHIIADLVSLPEGAVATGRLFWGCSVQTMLQSVGSQSCPDGGRPAAYAEVVVRASVTRLVAWPESLLSDEVEARAVVRIG